MSYSVQELLSLASQFEQLAEKVLTKSTKVRPNNTKKASSYYDGLLQKHAGVTIQFRPGEVKDMVQTALEMSGGKYEYSASGSRVGFSGKQFSDFVSMLKDALNDKELFDDAEKAEIQNTLNHVMSQLGAA